jgi:hypothetical protein
MSVVKRLLFSVSNKATPVRSSFNEQRLSNCVTSNLLLLLGLLLT